MIAFLKRTMARLLELAVMAVMIGGAGWCVGYCLDDEARQVKEGKKDPRTAILPVLPENR
ncbi:MAG: hypothetical protein KHX31_01365 [Akkermansia sp.]|uniref:hypothetical protein n=1 Tax=Akkermansia sp. TaxID=1872421 RepID=UPI0025BF37EA|nr:hypothetical protein [Akkermansia sp.]MBS5507262.1 hypothetical protein [Akkermansia sp.]